MHEGRDRIPWWALLVHAPLARVREELGRIRSTRTWADDDETAFVARGAWTGVYRYRREAVDFKLGDRLRRAGSEVILLDKGDRSVAHRWDAADEDWTDEDDGDEQLEDQLGFGDVHVQEAAPIVQKASLIEGAKLAAVKKVVDGDVRLIETARGIVALGDDGIESNASYRVKRKPDGAFSVRVRHGKGWAVFQRPAGAPTGGDAEIDDIEGETEPRKILAKLGIPVESMFPEGSRDNE